MSCSVKGIRIVRIGILLIPLGALLWLEQDAAFSAVVCSPVNRFPPFGGWRRDGMVTQRRRQACIDSMSHALARSKRTSGSRHVPLQRVCGNKIEKQTRCRPVCEEQLRVIQIFESMIRAGQSEQGGSMAQIYSGRYKRMEPKDFPKEAARRHRRFTRIGSAQWAT